MTRFHKTDASDDTMTVSKTFLFFYVTTVSLKWTLSYVSTSPAHRSHTSFLHKKGHSKTLLNLSSVTLPRLSQNNLSELTSKGYVIIDNFLPADLQDSLRKDVQSLREKGKFNIAKIGQDATNTFNTDIRVAETCFLGPRRRWGGGPLAPKTYTPSLAHRHSACF